MIIIQEPEFNPEFLLYAVYLMGFNKCVMT